MIKLMKWFVLRFVLSEGTQKKTAKAVLWDFVIARKRKKMLAKYSSTPNREKNGVGMHSNLVFKKTKTGGMSY
jgi:hypothetical protein